MDYGSFLMGENLMFTNCTATQEKGGAIVSSKSHVILFNITFNMNSAKEKGGCIYSTDNSAFSCNYCQFTNNVANISAGIHGSNNDLVSPALTLTNSIFVNNLNDESLLFISHTNSKIENVTFIDNIGRLVNNGITILKSVVEASNITVNYDKR